MSAQSDGMQGTITIVGSADETRGVTFELVYSGR